MALAGVGVRIVVVLVGMDPIARARLAVRLEEVRARRAFMQPADGGVARRPERLQPAEILREQADSAAGATGPSARNARNRPLTPAVARSRSASRPRAGRRRRPSRSAGPRARKRSSTSHATSRRCSRYASPSRVRFSPSCASTSARSGSRFASPMKMASEVSSDWFDEPRHFRFVRHPEAGIEIGFERELAQERQAEGVDGADLDVGEPIADRRPARAIERRLLRRPAQLADDPLAHFGRRLARERDRQDVGGIDASRQQVDVARDQHAGLAGAGRRLEHDVVRRITRELARLGVGIEAGRGSETRGRGRTSVRTAKADRSLLELVADVVLAADAGIRAPVAQERLVGPDRETLRARSRRWRSDEPHFPVGDRLRRILHLAERRLLLEGDVAGTRQRSTCGRGGPRAPAARRRRTSAAAASASAPARGRSCSRRSAACRRRASRCDRTSIAASTSSRRRRGPVKVNVSFELDTRAAARRPGCRPRSRTRRRARQSPRRPPSPRSSVRSSARSPSGSASRCCSAT